MREPYYDILGRMFDLAGGTDAPLVVIPTASGADDYPADRIGKPKPTEP